MEEKVTGKLSGDEIERIKQEEVLKIMQEEERRIKEKRRLLEGDKRRSIEELELLERQKKAEESRMREEIRKKEMMARGYEFIYGEWRSPEEAAKLKSKQERTDEELEKKKKNAVERKVAREKDNFKLKQVELEHQMKYYKSFLYVSAVLSIAGIVVWFVLPLQLLVFPMIVFGAGVVMGGYMFTMIMNAEAELLIASRYKIDGKINVFDSDWTNDTIRLWAQQVNARFNLEVKRVLEENIEDNQVIEGIDYNL